MQSTCQTKGKQPKLVQNCACQEWGHATRNQIIGHWGMALPFWKLSGLATLAVSFYSHLIAECAEMCGHVLHSLPVCVIFLLFVQYGTAKALPQNRAAYVLFARRACIHQSTP